MNLKPWILLDPNDFNSMWWRTNEIVDIQKYKSDKYPKNILAYKIIQDANIAGHYWYFSTWFFNDTNRYNSTILDWPFNKELTDMKEGEIVYLTDYPDIKFMVYYCKFASQCQYQVNYCKILERL
jgi:hypothetical protein